MVKYDDILAEIKNSHEVLIKDVQKFQLTARDKVKDLCEALREESTDGIKLSNDDIRDRVVKDCISYWKKETILSSLPDWLIRDYDKESEQVLVTNIYELTSSEEEKYKYDSIKESVLNLKRGFGTIIHSVNNKDDVSKAHNDLCYLEHTIKNIRERIEAEGRNQKAVLKNPITLKEKKMRKPISVYDLNFRTDAQTSDYIESGAEDLRLAIKQLTDIINGVYRYQILTLDEARDFAYSARSFLIYVFSAANNKSSQSVYEQLETDLLAEDIGDNRAAKNTKTNTLVCAKCIKKFDAEHNDIPPIMQIDKSSDTGFRCATCLETKMCERSLTKDIVEQRKVFLKRVSEHFTAYPPLQFIDIYSKKIKQVITGTKKVLMSNMLKKSSAFGSTVEQEE